jgi:hypothetical protein
MSKVLELERQLTEARNQAVKEENEAKLAEFKAALEGKYFMTAWVYRDGKATGAERYIDFKLEHGKVACTSQRMTVNVSYSKKTRHVFEPVGVRRDTNSYEHPEMLYDLTKNHIREITKKEFDAMWDLPLTLAEQLHRKFADPKWADAIGETTKTDDVSEVDVPFVVLEGPEISVLNGSPFLLPNNKHLVSAAAKKFVWSKIQEGRNMESRTSHLVETCDMPYFERQHETHRQLIFKFGL